MTLEAMFYVSQTVAAFAIVASVLFVGMEVRHSNRESRHRTIEEALENYRSARVSVIDHADVARAWITGLHDFWGARSRRHSEVSAYRRQFFQQRSMAFFCTTLRV